MPDSTLVNYLETVAKTGQTVDPGFVAYLSSIEQIRTSSPEVARAIVSELRDQRHHLKLIASENYCSLAVQLAQGNLLTDKYAEGVPFHRFYAGCANVDVIEALAASEACKLFGADHAYVQPHSGADANLVAYWTILSARVQTPILEKLGENDVSHLTDEQWASLRHELGNQRLMGMNYYSGGHLTHGYRQNISARMFDSRPYDVNRETNLLDYDEIRSQVQEFRPLILLAGYSAYCRKINFRTLKEIADEVGAVLMVDMAHFAGLVAGKVFTGDFDPVAHADVVTSTTHKTLRGPRGGIVLCKKEFAEYLDRGCPLVLGGPLPHAMAGKAVAFQEANTLAFQEYAHKIVENAQALAEACISEGIEVLTGGTDNHLMLLNVARFGLTGRQGESMAMDANITLNRNSLPFDANGPWYTSGLRIGTPATTTLGMGKDEMKEIAAILKLMLSNTRPASVTSGAHAGESSKAKYETVPAALEEARQRTEALISKYPVYPNLDLTLLEKAAGA